MAKTISELRNQSIQVRDASAAGENTATRVGTVLNDIVGHIEDYENTQSSNNSSQDVKIDSVKTSLNAEIARAKTEESNLSTLIGTERTERQAAVSSEETVRIQADNAEKTARMAADNAEQDARIKADNAEKTARENADITLRTMIQTEVSDREKAVAAEAARAKAAEKLNADAIATEEARATAAEQVNAQAIADEKARATAEEERLQGEIDNTNTNLTTLDDKVNSNHNHLTDEVARLDTTDNEIKADLEAEKAAIMGTDRIADGAVTIEKLSDDMLKRSKNLFNPYDPNIKKGYYIETDGSLTQNENYIVSDFIPLSESDGSLCASVNGVWVKGGAKSGLYDENKNLISLFSNEDSKGVLSWQDGVAYARFSIKTSDLSLVQIEYGNVITDFEPYRYIDNYFIHNVNTKNLADGAVTTAKIAEKSVTAEKLADGAVTIDKLANNAFDDEPTTGSDNLVKSGGVYNKTNQLSQEISTLDTFLGANEYLPVLLGNYYILDGVVTPFNNQTCKYFKVIKGQRFGIHFNGESKLRYGFFIDFPEDGDTAISYGSSVKDIPLLVAPSNGYFAFSYYSGGSLQNLTITPYSKIEHIDESVVQNTLSIAKIGDYIIPYITIQNAYMPDGKVTEYQGQSIYYYFLKKGTKVKIEATVSVPTTLRWGVFAEVPVINAQALVYGQETDNTSYTVNYVIPQDGYFAVSIYSNYVITFSFETKGIVEEIVPQVNENTLKIGNIIQAVEDIKASGHFNGLSSTFSLATSVSKTLGEIYVRKNSRLSLDTGTFTSLRFGVGYNKYQGYWIEVDSNTVFVYNYISSATLLTSYSHGLDISSGINVTIVAGEETASIILTDAFGTISKLDNINWWGGGAAFVTNLGNYTIEGSISYFPADITKKIWMFGDSYFSYNQTVRWLYYIINWGFKNWLANHLPGINSDGSIPSFNNLTKLGKPQFIVWCLGMNDGSDTDASTPQANWLNDIEKVIEYCNKNSIIPILATIPSVPNIYHEGKNNYVRNSGLRYIDFAKAVNAQPDGTWTTGLLSGDNIHPTGAGAKVLASQVLVDFPEIMEN